jgi:hypothetical protein
MSNAPDGDRPEDSPFSGGFDLYQSGKRRRGGLRRMAPASSAVTEPQPAPEPAPAPAAEPRSFSRMFAHREPRAEAADESPRLRQDDVEHPELAAVAGGTAMAAEPATEPFASVADDAPMMGASTLYASRSARRPSGATRWALPAVAVIAVAAGGAWFLMHPAHTARTDQTSLVAGGGPVVATAPAAPAPVATAPLAPPPAAIAPPETALPPAPIATAAPPPPAAPARMTHTTTTVTTTTTSRHLAANTRHAPRAPARSAATSGADVSTAAPDQAPAYTPPAYTPPAYTPAPPPAPVITAPAPAPAATPSVTPPVDPSGAVNPPTTP